MKKKKEAKKGNSFLFFMIIFIIIMLIMVLYCYRYYYIGPESPRPLPLPKGFVPGDEFKSVENITGEDFFNKSELYSFQALGTYGQNRVVLNLYAEVNKSDNKITLFFDEDSATVYKRRYNETRWTLIGNKTSPFIDTDIVLGEVYEYKLYKPVPIVIKGESYIYSGIEIPETNYRGSIVLLVDDAHSDSLSLELKTLELDLIGDGWKVIRHDVSRTLGISSIKELIKYDYLNNPDLKGIFILGHVPIPYSGDINPDGHMDHKGAWASDMFYADTIDENWTDSIVNNSLATRIENRNIPGDGKYDISYLDRPNSPNKIELFVGRVDLYNMPSFSLNETELLRQYLNKDHNFRNALVKASKRALIEDNFLYIVNGPSQTGWRLSGLVGNNNVNAVDFSELVYNDYLWAYGCGGGTYTSAGGIASTGSFSANTYKGMFYILYGSYFGDWDNSDNFLKAPLANPNYGLASVWGSPNWYFQRMGIGEPIGYSFIDSYKHDSSLYMDSVAGLVHISLLGDPTLRMDYIDPPKNLRANLSLNNVNLSWDDSNDDILGYQIYYSNSYNDTFSRISNIITENYFTDNFRGDGIYMVRAIALTTSSGSYYNPSQGTFSEVHGNLCVSDSECFINDICKTGKCNLSNGKCYVENNNSVVCDDMDPCTVNDRCSAGLCIGNKRDCSYLSDSCNTGACQNGNCIKSPANENQTCPNNLFCTINSICIAGLCTQGTSRDCNDNNISTYDYCNETNDSCEHYTIITDSDYDLVPDDIDICPNTLPPYRTSVNYQGCPKPIANKFNIKSNFNNSNLFNFPNLILGYSNYLIINFLENITLLRYEVNSHIPLDLDSNINISLRKLSINTNLSELNKKAKLIFYNVNYNHYQILKNNLNCTNCFIEYFNKTEGILIFNSTWPHNYEVVEILYCNDGLCNNNENCDSCPADCGVCSSDGNGGGSGGSGGGNGGLTTKVNKSANCTVKWSCTEYSSCYDNIQTRVCKDINNCNNLLTRPKEINNCSMIINITKIEEKPYKESGILVIAVISIIVILVIIILIKKISKKKRQKEILHGIDISKKH